jgi:hypothetical protein
MNDEGAVLVCMPTSLGPARVPSAIEKPCAGCGCTVWASPESIKAASRHGPVTYRCVPCVLAEPPPADTPFHPLSPGQVREVLDWSREPPA